MDFLNKAIQGYATALKFKPKDPSLHLLLGMTLEEAFFAEDMFGLKKEVCLLFCFEEYCKMFACILTFRQKVTQ